YQDHRHARLHVSFPGDEANLLGACLRTLLANLSPEGVGELRLSALLRLRGGVRGSLRFRLGLRLRRALLGIRIMRCSNEHHRGKHVSKHPRCKCDSKFHWTAPFCVTGDADADDTTC